jgi:hypothetical protein
LPKFGEALEIIQGMPSMPLLSPSETAIRIAITTGKVHAKDTAELSPEMVLALGQLFVKLLPATIRDCADDDEQAIMMVGALERLEYAISAGLGVSGVEPRSGEYLLALRQRVNELEVSPRRFERSAVPITT